MNTKKINILSVVLSSVVLLSTKAIAFGMMQVEDWQFNFSGNVNAFVVSTNCENDKGTDGVVEGGLACGSNGNEDRATNIRTGLLPSWFGFSAERNVESEDDFKTKVVIGFQPGVDGGAGTLDGALQGNSANFRQVFFEFGKPSFGTVKVGRDLGLFGGDAILSDMTLLGLGTISDLTKSGGRTSLGRIGVGYMYADWKGQLQYTSTDRNGFTFSAALVDPWSAGGLSGESLTGAQQADNFGFEGKVNLTFDKGKFWAGFISQDVEFDAVAAVVAVPADTVKFKPAVAAKTAVPAVSYDAQGFDVGIKLNPTKQFELVGYYYKGEGIGTTGFLLDGSSTDGQERDSDGFYIQATYKPNKTKFGISYGESNLDLASGEAVSDLVQSNESTVVGIYHSLNDALTLVAEYTNTESEAHNGNSAEEESFGIGGIMFF